MERKNVEASGFFGWSNPDQIKPSITFDIRRLGAMIGNIGSPLIVTMSNPTCPSCPTFPQPKFTGKPVSQTTGLYYDYRRWYDPTTGRFISRDPLAGPRSDPRTLNPYVYVLDSPTGLTDPSGMDSGGFLGPLDQYVVRPYLNWFDQNIEIPVLTWETGLSQATVTSAVNQNAGLENTLFDVGIVASAAVVTCVIACPLLIGESSTAAAFCGDDPAECEPPPSPPAPENEIDQFAKTLPENTRAPYTTQYGNIVRRAFGGDALQSGKFWTTANNLLTRNAAQRILGLPTGPPPQPVNTAEFLVEGYLVPGSRILVGRLPSGATEMIVDDPLSMILNHVVREIPS